MRRARRQLSGPLRVAALTCALGLSTACGRPTDAAPGPAGAAPPAGSAPVAPPAPGGAAPEARSVTAPLAIRVVSIRRENADSVRVDLSLANLADAATWTPDSAAAAAVRAAAAALDGASLLSADGRRRVFALRGSTGERVGSPVVVPAPGRPEPFWLLFPAAEGSVTVLLPGCAPIPGLTVTPRPTAADQPEP